jgi:hypothetical protein
MNWQAYSDRDNAKIQPQIFFSPPSACLFMMRQIPFEYRITNARAVVISWRPVR